VAPPLLSGERRYEDAIEWINRLEAFYRWMLDESMQELLAIERDRLSRRKDALEAVRLGTLKRNPFKGNSVVSSSNQGG
jgi:hypothetical protein